MSSSMLNHESESTAHSSLAHRLQLLEDIEAIKQLKYLYATHIDAAPHAVGAANLQEIISLFTADAKVDFGAFGQYRGHAELQKFYGEMISATVVWSRHHALHPIIRVDGQTASAQWALQSTAVYKAHIAGGPQTTWARYQDEYVKTAQGWKIRSLTVTFENPPTVAPGA